MDTPANRQVKPHITIGAVARRAGVGIDTIRYYEREGLLPEPQRRASGYRDYGPDVVERLRFIRRAKDLGFTLEEIRELLALSTDRERGVKTVKQRAEARLGEVEHRIRELQPWFHGEYVVILQDGTRLMASRVFSDRLDRLIA